MKRKLTVITALVICAAMIISLPIVTVAATPAFSADFESGPCGFIPAGDLDGDGTVDYGDFKLLADIILSDAGQTYGAVTSALGVGDRCSDVNGDGFVEVRDFVRAKKSCTAGFIVSTEGVGNSAGMIVCGNVSLKSDITGKLTAGSCYQLTLSHKGAGSMKVTLRDIGEKEYTFSLSATSKWKNNKYLIATPTSIKNSSDIQVSICGDGIIDNFAIAPASNIDNDLADNW